MSRSITSRGAPWPQNILYTRTFDSNFQYEPTKPQNGLDWEVYEHQFFPWLAGASETDTSQPDTSRGQFIVQLPGNDGVERNVMVTPQRIDQQTVINGEMSCIIPRHEWESLEIPDLAFLMPSDDPQGNGTMLRMQAVAVPLQHADRCMGVVDNFTIVAVDHTLNTITVEASTYYRKRPTTAVSPNGRPLYDLGSHWGYNRYARDQLVTDAQRDIDEFKRHTYEHSFIRFGGNLYRYNRVVDSTAQDFRAITYSRLYSLLTSPGFSRLEVDSVAGILTIVLNTGDTLPLDFTLLKEANQDLLDEMATIGPSELSNATALTSRFQDSTYGFQARERPPTTHTLHMIDMPPTVAHGSKVAMMRHLPYATTMLTTNGTFSQRPSGIWDFRVRFDAKRRQFSAPWLWPNQRETNQRRFDKAAKEKEHDGIEFPGGTTAFFNMHRPTGGMLNYAEENNLIPVMGHPEWTENYKQQHQELIAPDHPHFINYFDWFTLRYAIWGPNNPYGKPPWSAEWYLQCNDGIFRFTAGALLSPDHHEDVLQALQIFLVNPVDGNFVADMEYFAPGSGPLDETLPIKFDVSWVRVAQLEGFEAGGAGYPDPAGRYPNGFRPTPNDITGKSGTGLIGVGTTVEPPEPVSGYREIGSRYDGSRLLEVEPL